MFRPSLVDPSDFLATASLDTDPTLA